MQAKMSVQPSNCDSLASQLSEQIILFESSAFKCVHGIALTDTGQPVMTPGASSVQASRPQVHSPSVYTCLQGAYMQHPEDSKSQPVSHRLARLEASHLWNHMIPVLYSVQTTKSKARADSASLHSNGHFCSVGGGACAQWTA